MSRKTRQHERSDAYSPRLIPTNASAPSDSLSNTLKTISQRLRASLALRQLKRDRQTEGTLNLLLDAFQLDAWALGLRSAAYAGIPERWIMRDGAGRVRYLIVGGIA